VPTSSIEVTDDNDLVLASDECVAQVIDDAGPPSPRSLPLMCRGGCAAARRIGIDEHSSVRWYRAAGGWCRREQPSISFVKDARDPSTATHSSPRRLVVSDLKREGANCPRRGSEA